MFFFYFVRYLLRSLVKEGDGEEGGGEGTSRPNWLIDIRDSKMRRPTDPDYDPTTIYIPPEAEKDLTPAKKQFWSFKKNKFDESTFLFYTYGDSSSPLHLLHPFASSPSP